MIEAHIIWYIFKNFLIFFQGTNGAWGFTLLFMELLEYWIFLMELELFHYLLE